MKNNVVSKSILTAIFAFSLTACSGSGSDPGKAISEPSAAVSGNETGDEGPSQGTIAIAVTNPSGGSAMATPDDSVILEGTAESSNEIVSVSWASDRGSDGVTSGNAMWATTAIPLETGSNEITITAQDSSGATATHTVVVTKESAATESVTLAWEAPATRQDGSELSDLMGYVIKYGQMSETYDYQIDIDNPGILSHVVEGLSSGEWYFVVNAYDSQLMEGAASNEVVLSIP